MRVKEDLGFSPSWEGPIKKWTCKYLAANRWRVDPILELEDLVQDAFLLYLKLVDFYPAVRQPQHFMALFKTALKNQVTDYARAIRDRNEVVLDTEADVPEFANWGYVAALLANAPNECKALAVFFDEKKIIELQHEEPRPKFSRKGLVPRENLNAKLVRLAGLDPKSDVVTKLRKMLT